MNADFSRTLALLRQEKGISQRKAAKELGISQALLSHYENGIREPGLAFVKKACTDGEQKQCVYERAGGCSEASSPSEINRYLAEHDM